jgi:hypothetical protein
MNMRRLLVVLAACVLGLATAGSAQAEAIGFTGSLAVQIATLPPVVLTASGVSTVNGSAGAGHLTALDIASNVAAISDFVVPVTDPAAFPIQGIQVTAMNGAGDFDLDGGTLTGTMAIGGVTRVCLFAPCSTPPPANVNVPLTVVGQGGTTTVSALVNLTVVGAPWTSGTGTVGTITQMGFAHGPLSNTSSTAQDGGVVRLVTPVFVSTNIGASAVLPVFGILTLTFGAPEPGQLALGSGAIAALIAMGVRRRRAS